MARNSFSRSAAGGVGGGCGCLILIAVINLAIGGFCLNYSLDTMFGTTISSWFVAGLLGLILGEITIPLAFVCLIANLIQVTHPWFPHAIK